jgi:Antidote-toxin recognition MazE, bacterial antitoxin
MSEEKHLVGKSDFRRMGMSDMSGGSAKQQPRPRITVRSRLRPKAQLTLPEEIRRALRVSEGDLIEFAVDEDGTIRARGFVSIPSDQIQYFTAGGAGR